MSWPDPSAATLFDQNPLPMLVFDTETRELVAVNDALVASYGYTREEFLRMRIDDLRPNEAERKQLAEALNASLREGNAGPAAFPGNWRHRKKDGRIVDVDIWRVRVLWEGRRCCVVLPIDVTERRAAEASLRETQALWLALAESSPDSVLVVDADNRITHVGRVSEGYSRATLIGADAVELLYEGDRAMALATLATVRGERRARVIEVRTRASDGSFRWYESRCSPIDLGPRGTGVLFVSSDVTARKRLHDALRASEKRFRTLVERSSDALVMFDARGVIVYVSDAALMMSGHEQRQIVGGSVLDLVHPDDRAPLEASLLEITRTPGGTARSELRLRYGDGSYRWVEKLATSLLEDESVSAVVATFREIDDRKRAEDALRASEERYRMLFDASPMPMWVVAADGEHRFLEVNDKTVEAYGYSRDELLGMTVFDIRPPEDREALRAVVRRPEARRTTGPWRHRRKDGSDFDAEVTSAAILYGGRAARFVVVRDVTEKRALEEQLNKAQKMEAIGLLAGGVAHDFNNLLGIVSGSVELARREVEAGGDPTKNLAAIASAAERAASLTRKLLAFSKKQVLRVETRDLRDLIADFSALLARVVREDVELALMPGDEPLPVNADTSQLEQVLLNLCTNARQAMPQGGRIVVSLQRRALAPREALADGSRECAELSVADTGSGMDEATRARVFEPFFTTRGEGTGLGLATVYGIVQQHGGTVTVESSLGRGSTFRVRLPLSGQRMRPTTPPHGVAAHDMRGGRETVLVAEDEPALRNVISKMLTELGYQVIVVGDGEAAVRELEQRRREIALVILDVVMPRLGGPEAYQRMRDIDPSLRVLFTTGYAPKANAMSALAGRGGHAVLDKPFRMHELAAKVREALDAGG